MTWRLSRQRQLQALAGVAAGIAVAFLGVALAITRIDIGVVVLGQSALFGAVFIIAGLLLVIGNAWAAFRLRRES
ncbi:hypothetical protein [Microbacterium radiodurans]|uniref:Uncharacterized protein n=1 Tax=Microbacterium radiodurans TaxID=661398 RepID=A0A5J5IN57_9MICO|nr:hypothetical protein [Microbacterium radiodurans]KAA9084144.1 hypothetical protein F6B42_14285 [Microbacterium radiodurans]